MGEKVKIYTTASCHYCHQLKEFLAGKGVEYDAFDVGQDKEAMQEMKRVTGGARSVPVIVIGEKVIVGFDQPAVEAALKQLQS